MARTIRVNHSKRIVAKTKHKLTNIKSGEIISFKYRVDGVSDRWPMVIVLKTQFEKGTLKSKKGVLEAININYLQEHAVTRLISESNYKKMKYWHLYKNAFRTYKISNITRLELVDYTIKSENRKPGEWWKEKWRNKIVWNAKDPKGKMPKYPFSDLGVDGKPEGEELAKRWAMGTLTEYSPDETLENLND
tara:strand:+ start:169 stop:741 length:573 start_codon:yes stop_codon:yes gene_type:complete